MTVNAKNVKSLKLVLIITALFMIVEAVGGIFTNSLALLGDSVHMLTDIAALGLSLVAFMVSSRPATLKKTFGFYRFEILAAFVNGIFLVVLSLVIIWQAYGRFWSPEPIKAPEMIGIASLGLIVNLVGAWVLTRGGDGHNHLNMQGALFHVIGDALGSVGAIVAGLLVYYYEVNRADPIVSVIVALIIIVSAFKLISDTTHVILEGVPHHLDIDEIQETLRKVQDVLEVHDLHVWSITSGMVSLSVHIVAKESDSCFHHDLLLRIRKTLKEIYNIDHVTIQIEDESLRATEPHI